MSTPVRIAAFAAALVVVLGAAFGLGRVVGPFEPAPAGPHVEDTGEHRERDTGERDMDEHREEGGSHGD